MGGEKDEPWKWVSWSAGRAVGGSYKALDDCWENNKKTKVKTKLSLKQYQSSQSYVL